MPLIRLDSSDQFPNTVKIIEEGLESGVASAISGGIYSLSDDRYYLFGRGKTRLDQSAPEVNEKTRFDLASLTKVLATTPLFFSAWERGLIDLDDTVGRYFPEATALRNTPVYSLLAHTSGLPAWKPFFETIRERIPKPLYEVPVEFRQKSMRGLVLSVEPEYQLGSQCVYSDVGFLILGFILENIYSEPLDQAVKTHVWRRMRSHGLTFYRILKSSKENVLPNTAATENCPWRGTLQGQVHDDNCWAMGGYGGHAGVFGNPLDVLAVAKELMGSFLMRSTKQLMWSRITKPSDCHRTLGWDGVSPENSSVGTAFSDETFGHLGFTGTSLWIDLKNKVAVTLLTNRVHFSRENDKIKRFRPRFHEAIWEELIRLKGAEFEW